MLSLPRELIIHISTFTSVIYNKSKTEEDTTDYTDILNYVLLRDDDYAMWNLYATCKSFQWMLDIQCFILCLDESIVSKTINNVYHGPHYDIRYNDIEYYANGNTTHSEKCDKEIMKKHPIVKFLIEKNDCDYMYLHYTY